MSHRSRRPVAARTPVLASLSVLPAGRFKATCLAVMDAVQRTGRPVTITKRGTPVVRVVPAIPTDAPPLFGRLKGSLRITGDVVGPVDVEWDVLADQ